ncbi:unnamed protein product [Ostreobium quekettii]|uniref:BZIP domain-containing protein n=1 Tax=Ostreobium quekettii TaxID=121088 RepID=A0A8S1IUZ1_9CHLO|nr:unnamed protein product [Ostreobium quekettii]|eukprot:evm.model.scf_3.7 EVM.evm.TU.scf_3.7   scf_3:132316-134492(-)
MSSMWASCSDGGSQPQGSQDGQLSAADAAARRERSRLQQKKSREGRKRREEELEGAVGELREKVQYLMVKNAELERENDILWAYVQHYGGLRRPETFAKT